MTGCTRLQSPRERKLEVSPTTAQFSIKGQLPNHSTESWNPKRTQGSHWAQEVRQERTMNVARPGVVRHCRGRSSEKREPQKSFGRVPFQAEGWNVKAQGKTRGLLDSRQYRAKRETESLEVKQCWGAGMRALWNLTLPEWRNHTNTEPSRHQKGLPLGLWTTL